MFEGTISLSVVYTPAAAHPLLLSRLDSQLRPLLLQFETEWCRRYRTALLAKWAWISGFWRCWFCLKVALVKAQVIQVI